MSEASDIMPSASDGSEAEDAATHIPTDLVNPDASGGRDPRARDRHPLTPPSPPVSASLTTPVIRRDDTVGPDPATDLTADSREPPDPMTEDSIPTTVGASSTSLMQSMRLSPPPP